MHGFGTFRWVSAGKQYTGQFVRGDQEGYGECTYGEGTIYKGQWKNDKFHGQGTYIWPNGRSSTGNWVQDKRHGDQVFTNALG